MHMAVQTDACVDENSSDIPDELLQTIGSHLWLANLETSAGTPPDVRLKPQISRHPLPNEPAALTRSQLLDTHTQLGAARKDRNLSKMLEGVVTSMHCLTKFSREAGLTRRLKNYQYQY